jgi:glycosyltransferase involved in cell wall biosynthesis
VLIYYEGEYESFTGGAKLKAKIKRVVLKHPLLHRVAKKAKRVIIGGSIKEGSGTSIDYEEWIEKNEPVLWQKHNPNLGQPLVSIVVPAYNTPNKYLQPLVESLVNQTFSNWQLCISDASTDVERQVAIEDICKKDKRIAYVYAKGLHISANTNQALKLVKGDYVGLLDHDDVLSPHALEEVVSVIQKNTEVELIYSDEDKLSDDGKTRQLPFFKPDWSPDLLMGVNYITHFLVVKTDLLKEVNGLRSDFDGAQDYDLLLRLTEKTNKIVHIPKILYHWRLADGSTAKEVGEKSYADTAGQRALQEAVQRRRINAEVVEIPDRPTNYRLRFSLPKKQPMVSIVIPFKDKPELLKQCVESILTKTTYENYEIVLVSNNSEEKETFRLLDRLGKSTKCRVYKWDFPFNYSKVNNFGVSKAKGEYIVLLNNDTEVITPEWLDELVGVSSQPGVGAVGPLLLYPDTKNGIQHAGVILGMGSMAGHVFRHHQPGDWTHFGIPLWPRNYLAVTAACMIVSRKLYDEVGGLDEAFIVAGNDVAFCLSLHEKGYRNIYWPYASLYHYESVSVGTYNNGIQSDYDHSLKYYKKYHELGDPYFNKNLDLMNEQIGMRSEYEETHK